MTALTWLHDDSTPLPDTRRALGVDTDAPGLLAAGGTLSLPRLEEAYRKGVFPWFSDGQPVLWWSTDPRMVLPVEDFKLSRSLRKTVQRFMRTPGCELRVDSAFPRVIAACAGTPREGQAGTWIVPEIVAAYTAWHRAGRVHSFETWIDGQLVGGLYGVSIGRMFYGESMFSHRTDASKIALAGLVAFCRVHGIGLIDCQQNTGHLASLGAHEIPRAQFEAHLAQVLPAQGPSAWAYDPAYWAQLGLRGEPSA
ncbi:leucyl/phenylalanyl-tRNA--protein transferase [Aquincola sp. J276]|uniref:leucyl/phenylalanyl-tRNA--protein transferase n=1 Tax=Aquincola sp. J276 TaxID=2898432 RepID=UPI002151E7BE|nr:leucyl/phenylalanyl-tRNA--protein transferase [Aquincola sp. J276]MCR5864790.1 leucyl/phenylalanyl-tRNA--protein transferase [Aquincola sp. J276]